MAAQQKCSKAHCFRSRGQTMYPNDNTTLRCNCERISHKPSRASMPSRLPWCWRLSQTCSSLNCDGKHHTDTGLITQSDIIPYKSLCLVTIFHNIKRLSETRYDIQGKNEDEKNKDEKQNRLTLTTMATHNSSWLVATAQINQPNTKNASSYKIQPDLFNHWSKDWTQPKNIVSSTETNQSPQRDWVSTELFISLRSYANGAQSGPRARSGPWVCE